MTQEKLEQRWTNWSYENPPSNTPDFIRAELQKAAEIAEKTKGTTGALISLEIRKLME